MHDDAAGNAVAVESFASDRQRHTAGRSPTPRGTRDGVTEKNRNIVCGSKRAGCHQRGLSGHPLDFLPRNGETWSNELPGLRGKRVTLCGWVVTYRHVGTKNYRNMMFVTLEDQRGVYEAVLFPEAYARYGGLVFETRALRVTGRVEQDGQVNCDGLAALKK